VTGSGVTRTSEPRRLVFLDDRYHEVYGAQENVLLLAELCQRRGHDVVFVTTAPGRLSESAVARGLRVEVIVAPPELLQFEREAVLGGLRQLVATTRALLSYSRRLDHWLATFGPDLVMPSAVRPATLLLVSRLRRRAPIALYAQNSIPFGGFALLAGLISWRICLIGPGAMTTFPRPSHWILRRRLRALPSGRDLDRYSAADQHEAERPSGAPFRVLTVCSVTRRKGIHLVIEAAASAQRSLGRAVEVTVVGATTGPKSEAYLGELVEQASSSDVVVRFAGWCDDVVAHLRATDLFVLASFDEGLPGVLLEAMAAGLPCVSTDAGSAGDLVRSSGSGIALPVGDAVALASAMERMILDEPERRRFGVAGRKSVLAEYGLEAFADRFDAILAELEQRRRDDAPVI
jgi:glycosyltransferase involved in cell wall biosynthesis